MKCPYCEREIRNNGSWKVDNQKICGSKDCMAAAIAAGDKNKKRRRRVNGNPDKK